MSLRKLERFAAQRLKHAPHSSLAAHVHQRVSGSAFSHPLVPEGMSLGYRTPHWRALSEEAQLALNHWIYDLKYYRICDGEIFVRAANEAVARFVEEGLGASAKLAALLRHENQEEADHISAFGAMRRALHAHHQTGPIRMPVKPARALMISPRTLAAVARVLGADFVVTYFLARGLVNHMGKGFEVPVSKSQQVHASVRALSRLHTLDENKHMALSSYMAQLSYALMQRPNRGALQPAYQRVLAGFQRFTLRYTLSAQTTLGQEVRMSKAVLPKMKALRKVDPALLEATIDAHFQGESGMEAAKNAYMSPFNERLMERACLQPQEKRAWIRTIAEHQGRLRFFQEGFVKRHTQG